MIVDHLQVGGIQENKLILSLANLENIFKICKESGANLIVDISTTFSLLADDYFKNNKNFHYLVSDLRYYAGVDTVRTAAILSNDLNEHSKALVCVNAIGAAAQPMDCFLTIRGLKTLAIRIDDQKERAIELQRSINSKGKLALTFDA